MSENGTIHITMMKNWVSHLLFLRKRGLILYLAAGGYSGGTSVLCHISYIGSYPPPPPDFDTLIVFLKELICKKSADGTKV